MELADGTVFRHPRKESVKIAFDKRRGTHSVMFQKMAGYYPGTLKRRFLAISWRFPVDANGQRATLEEVIRCRGELEEVLEREGFESAKAFLANFKRG